MIIFTNQRSSRKICRMHSMRKYWSKIIYNVRRVDLNQWLVLKKTAWEGKQKSLVYHLPPVYNRVRIVLISSNQYMTCSCGYVQRRLIQYSHIYADLDKKRVLCSKFLSYSLAYKIRSLLWTCIQFKNCAHNSRVIEIVIRTHSGSWI